MAKQRHIAKIERHHRVTAEHPHHATAWTVLVCPVCRKVLEDHMARVRANENGEIRGPEWPSS